MKVRVEQQHRKHSCQTQTEQHALVPVCQPISTRSAGIPTKQRDDASQQGTKTRLPRSRLNTTQILVFSLPSRASSPPTKTFLRTRHVKLSLPDDSCTFQIQKCARGFMGRRKAFARREEVVRERVSVAIQAAWRGLQGRRKAAQTKRDLEAVRVRSRRCLQCAPGWSRSSQGAGTMRFAIFRRGRENDVRAMTCLVVLTCTPLSALDQSFFFIYLVIHLLASLPTSSLLVPHASAAAFLVHPVLLPTSKNNTPPTRPHRTKRRCTSRRPSAGRRPWAPSTRGEGSGLSSGASRRRSPPYQSRGWRGGGPRARRWRPRRRGGRWVGRRKGMFCTEKQP